MARRQKVPDFLRDEAKLQHRAWLEQRVEIDRPEPRRRGIPRGEEIGLFSKAERVAWHHVALTPSFCRVTLFTLQEIADLTGDSLTLANQRRRQKSFQRRVAELSKDFADFIADQILTTDNRHTERILAELLVLLPGFDVRENSILNKWKTLLSAESFTPMYFDDLVNIMRLNFNIITLFMDKITKKKVPAIKQLVANTVDPLLDEVDQIVKAGKAKGVLTEEVAAQIAEISLKITFVTRSCIV